MATIEDYRAKARERWRRHQARQAAAGELRIATTLPAGLLAEVDAARGAAGRSAVIQQALRMWLRRQPATPVPAPPPPPARKMRRPRRALV
jgi:hypothetical protein